jgi:hypothetical protein
MFVLLQFTAAKQGEDAWRYLVMLDVHGCRLRGCLVPLTLAVTADDTVVSSQMGAIEVDQTSVTRGVTFCKGCKQGCRACP